MSDPEVSVVIPVHNGAEFVERAICSALDQRDVTVEVIVVDDASTDETPEIIARFGDGVRYFRLSKQKNGIAATNEGIRQARGQLVCVLHHDDYLLPDKLARQAALMAQHPDVGLSYSAQYYVDEHDRRLWTLRSPVRHGDYVVPGEVELRRLIVQNYINFCNAVVRRSVFDSVGLFPDEWQITSEWAMWTRIARHGYAFGYVDEPLVCYRMHAGQLTMKRTPAGYLEQLAAVHDETFNDPTLHESVRRRQRLAWANVELNIALVHGVRGERLDALRVAARAMRSLRPWELRDFTRSSALVPRVGSRLRLRKLGSASA